MTGPLQNRATQTRRCAAVTTLSALVLGALAACGSASEEPSTAAEPTKTEETMFASEIAESLPKKVRDAGVIRVVEEPFYPPFILTEADNKTLTGIDPALAQALGEVLGIKVETVSAPFDSVIPGLLADRYDLAMGAMFDNPEREKLVDFVHYYRQGSAVFVPSANPKKIEGLADLCGKSIGVVSGSGNVDDAKGQGEKCVSAGDQPVDLKEYKDGPGMILALTSGRVDSILMSSPAGNYAAKESNGAFKQVGDYVESAKGGMIFAKDDQELRDAVRAALQKLMDNGTYLSILKEWGAEKGALDEATMNQFGAQ